MVNIVYVYVVVMMVPLWCWQVGALFFAGLLLFVVLIMRVDRLRWGIVCAGISLLLTSAVACRYAADKACWYSTGTPGCLYVGPDRGYHVVGDVQPGQAVCIRSHEGDWLYVQNEKCRGWLPLKP